MANLLLVEDDASVRQIVMLQLSLVGYDVRAAEDAGQARRMMEEKTPDLVILDIMLPGEDGFSLAETMMERAVPVLFLTAKTAVSDRVRGLRMGAEDYMLKPFEPEELLARVENILRRTRKARTHFVFGALVVDLPSRRVTKGEREVALTALEFDLLAMLVRRSNVAPTLGDAVAETAPVPFLVTVMLLLLAEASRVMEVGERASVPAAF